MLAITACVAPPIGIGRGATVDAAQTSVGIGAAATEHRTVGQLDAAYRVSRSGRFELDVGVAWTAYTERRDGRVRDVTGGFPYLRPRWTFGGASLAIAASAIMLAGGEGGVLAGFTDAQLGYGGARWSLYAGAYGSACAVADGGPIALAIQARAGAEYWPLARVGVALEVYRQRDSLDLDGRGHPTAARFTAVGGKLRVAW